MMQDNQNPNLNNQGNYVPSQTGQEPAQAEAAVQGTGAVNMGGQVPPSNDQNYFYSAQNPLPQQGAVPGQQEPPSAQDPAYQQTQPVYQEVVPPTAARPAYNQNDYPQDFQSRRDSTYMSQPNYTNPHNPHSGYQQGQNYGGMPMGPTPNEPLAIASLSLGIASLVLMFIPGISILAIAVSIAAIVTGIIAMSKIKKSNGALAGQGMAVTGLVLGSVFLILSIIVLIACAACFASLQDVANRIPDFTH